MDSTAEWLRYIESQRVMQEYNIKGYSTGSVDSNSEEEN